MLNILLATPAPACGFTAVNVSNWLGISALVILAIVTLAGLVYAVSNLMPTERRTRLRGAASYEMYEALLGLIIIAALFMLSSVECHVGAMLAGQSSYQNVFATDTNFVGNLLFLNGLAVTGNLYSASIEFIVVANVYFYASTQLIGFFGAASWIPKSGGTPIVPGLKLSFAPSSSIDALMLEFSNLFTAIYGLMLIVTFGGLFVLMFAIPIIQAGAFTAIVPVAILMRSLPFAGPQLRRTSNEFLALAIALYLVFPLTIMLNSYVASCLKLSIGGTGVSCASFTGLTSIQNYLTQSYASSITSGATSIFTSNPATSSTSATCTVAQQAAGTCSCASGAAAGACSSFLPSTLQGINLPSSFWGTVFFSSQGLSNLVTAMFNAPAVAQQYGFVVAEYMFLGVVMVAIDLAITVGFALGLAKGFNYFNRLFSEGPVLGE